MNRGSFRGFFATLTLGVASIGGLGLTTAPAAAASGAITKLPIPSADLASPVPLALNGSMLYVGNELGDLTIVPTAKPLTAFLLPDSAETVGLAVSPDGKELFADNPSSGLVETPISANGVPSLAGSVDFSPGSYSYAVPFGIALNLTGTTVLITNFGTSSTPAPVLVADVATATVTGEVLDPHVYIVKSVAAAFAPSGKTAYVGTIGGLAVLSVTGPASDPVYTATKLITATDPVDGGNFGVAVSPDGRIIYVAETGATGGGAGTPVGTKVLAVSAATNRIVNTFAGFSGPTGLALTRDGNTLYVANTGSNTIDKVALATLVSRPKLNGQATVGRTLRATATASKLGSARVKLSYQWLANGHPIRHATKPSLKLTRADRHKHISVRVSGTAPGLTTTTLSSVQTKAVN